MIDTASTAVWIAAGPASGRDLFLAPAPVDTLRHAHFPALPPRGPRRRSASGRGAGPSVRPRPARRGGHARPRLARQRPRAELARAARTGARPTAAAHRHGHHAVLRERPRPAPPATGAAAPLSPAALQRFLVVEGAAVYLDRGSDNDSPAGGSNMSWRTQVIDGGLVRVLSWYDNEWGFSNRMLDTAAAMGKLG